MPEQLEPLLPEWGAFLLAFGSSCCATGDLFAKALAGHRSPPERIESGVPHLGTDYISVDEEKRICFRCVGNEFLSLSGKREGQIGGCSYCSHREDPTFKVTKLADCGVLAFEQYYVRTASQPNLMQYVMLADKESDYSWDRNGEPVDDVITNAASVKQDVACDIREILADRFGDWEMALSGEETESDGDSYYERKSVNSGRWTREWENFEHFLKTEARFFSRRASTYLIDLFDGLDTLKARDKISVLAVPVPVSRSPVYIGRGHFPDMPFSNGTREARHPYWATASACCPCWSHVSII